ncbi:MAG: PAS domain S-box protein [Cyanophyceae cyanobacterium]
MSTDIPTDAPTDLSAPSPHDYQDLKREYNALRDRLNQLEESLQAAAPPAPPPPPSVRGDRPQPPGVDPLFRSYVETANDMVYTVDLTGCLTFINPYGEQLLGRTHDEWEGQPYMDFVAPRFRESTAKIFEKLLTTGEVVDFEFALVNKDGEEIQVQVNGQLLHQDGQLIGGLGIARDITERKRFERQLKMLSRALESSHDSAVISDLNGKIIYVNAATHRTFGYEEGTLVGENTACFYPEAGPAQVAWLSRQAVSGGWSGEVICQRKGGRRFPALLSVGGVADEDGNPVAFSAIVRDISDQKQNQAELAAKNIELERASRMKSEFLANMSHELRTPLTAILGFSSLLGQQLYGPLNEKQSVYVDRIRNSGDHLLSLINDVLDLSKVEAGQAELEIGTVDIAEVCQGAIAIISEQAKARDIKIYCDIPKDIGTLMAEELRVRQMLLNLLSNALKFSSENKSIGLQARTSGGYLHLSVWDNGIGIPEEAKGLLFQPFLQLDSSLSRRHEGTGLGLVLTKQLAELHGGSVDFESTLGEGSTFTIHLPLNTPPLRPAAEAATESDSTPLSKTVRSPFCGDEQPTILIIEDDPYNAQLLNDTLAGWGYRAVIASTGEEGLAQLEREPVCMVLLDIQLPDMDGFAVLDAIRSQDRWAELPVVAATALAMTRDRDRCLRAGMQDYLSKPLNYETLGTLLTRHTGFPPAVHDLSSAT